MSDDELSPEQERVRALLAQARVDTPVPDDVAERLDRVLAQLADEDVGAPAGPANLVDLASRRRRKAATLLVAAAAVVAVGIGIGTVVPSSTNDSASDRGAAAPGDAAAEDRNGAGSDAESAPEATSSSRLVADEPRRVRPDHFADDVAQLRVVTAFDAPDAEAEQASPEELDSSLSDGASAFMCDPAAWGPGRLVAVYYDGTPAVLAFRPTTGDTQVVDLLECGTAAILRSVTLPAP